MIQDEYTRCYNDGYKEGFKEGEGTGHTLAYDKGYNNGLNDAWECARKILFDPTHPKELPEALGTDTFCGIIEKYSASEAIQKIKEYEEQQDYKHRVTKKSIIKSHIEDMLENYTFDEIAEVLEWMKGEEE